jgi:hypothetical protein
MEARSQQLMPPHHLGYMPTSSAEALNGCTESTIDIDGDRARGYTAKRVMTVGCDPDDQGNQVRQSKNQLVFDVL